MCMICFGSFLVDDAYEDVTGQKWDICKACDALDKAALEIREALGGSVVDVLPGPDGVGETGDSRGEGQGLPGPDTGGSPEQADSSLTTERSEVIETGDF